MNNITPRVLKILSEVLNEHSLPPHPFVKDQCENWDSLKHFEIIFACEEEFNVRFSSEQAAAIRGSQDLVDLIEASYGA